MKQAKVMSVRINHMQVKWMIGTEGLSRASVGSPVASLPAPFSPLAC